MARRPPQANVQGLQHPGPERCRQKRVAHRCPPSAPLFSISRSSYPYPPAPLLRHRPRPAPALSLAQLAGWASPGFKGTARRAALGAAAGPGLAACGVGCPEEAATVVAAVRPQHPGPRLPSCQVGRRSARAAPPLPSWVGLPAQVCSACPRVPSPSPFRLPLLLCPQPPSPPL